MATSVSAQDIKDALEQVARDYDKLAGDLQRGTDIRGGSQGESASARARFFGRGERGANLFFLRGIAPAHGVVSFALFHDGFQGGFDFFLCRHAQAP